VWFTFDPPGNQAGATIVIDGEYEFELLRQVVPEGKRTPVMLRLSPGVKPDTHDHISTGQLDSKFGFSIESGAARRAVQVARTLRTLNAETVRLADEPVYRDVQWVSSYRIDPFGVSAADKIALLQEYSERLMSSDGIDHAAAAFYGVKEQTFYTRYGDWFPLICAVFGAGMLAAALFKWI